MKTSAAQLARNKRWRRKNGDQMREIRSNAYYRNREWICWKQRLTTLLMNVVRAHGDPPGC